MCDQLRQRKSSNLFREMNKRKSTLKIQTIPCYSKKGLLSQTSFSSLEENYRNVLQDLMSQEDMGDVAAEYKYMYKEIQKLKKAQEELIKKNGELHSEMGEKVKELETAQSKSKTDKEMIQQLKEEAKRDYKAIYSEICEEQGLKELMNHLWPQMIKLNKELEDMARFQPERLESPSRMFQFNEMKDKLIKERQGLLQVATALKKKLNVVKQANSSLELKSSAAEMKARKLMADLEMENQKITVLQKQQRLLEDRKLAVIKEMNMIDSEHKAFNKMIEDACLKIKQFEVSTKEMESTTEKAKGDMDQLRHILSTYHAEYKTLIENMKNLGRVFINTSSQEGDVAY